MFSLGYSNVIDSKNNHVVVKGTVTGKVIGGYSQVVDGLVTGNTVEILGGHVVGSIIGGAGTSNSAGAVTTTNNTINLKDATVDGDGEWYGNVTGGANSATGNTLKLSGANTVGGKVENFEAINFENIAWSNTTVLTLTSSSAEGIEANNAIGAVTFASPENIESNDSMTLIQCTNSAKIADDLSLQSSYTQAIKDYNPGNGAKLNATLSGTLAKTATTLTHTATGTTLNSVNLANWDGTAGTLPTGWTGNGIAVETGRFTAPESVAPGAKREIFTAMTAGFFGTVTGDNAYKNNEAFSEAEKGVTLKGKQNGGVKTENEGRELNYYGISKSVNNVSFGEMMGDGLGGQRDSLQLRRCQY